MKKTLRILALAMVTIILTLALVSCGGPNADPSKAKVALEDKGYNVTKIDADGNFLEKGVLGAMELAGIDDIANVITASNDDGEKITIIYFEDKEAAKAELEDVQDYSKAECKLSGNMIYYGTEAAIKAAK